VAVQLREKDLEGRALLELARALRAVTAAAGAQLYINDRVDVALAAAPTACTWAGARWRRPTCARWRRGCASGCPRTRAPRSSAAARAGADFVVFGPVFATPSKPGFHTGSIDCAGDALECRCWRWAESTRKTRIRASLAGASGVACIRSVMAATKLPESS
jgi:thiamine-phosphate pyrophosphorylase